MQGALVTSQDLLKQKPSLRTIWIAGTSLKSLTKAAVARCRVAIIAEEVRSLADVALHTKAVLMQGLCLVLTRQYDQAIDDALRTLGDELTVKKISRRDSSWTISTVKRSGKQLVFSGDLKGTVLAMDFVPSEEKVRSRYVARPEEINLVEQTVFSVSSRGRNSFGFDDQFSRHMLEIEADPNFSPALVLSFPDLAGLTPRASHMTIITENKVVKPKRKKVADDCIDISLHTLRNWTLRTEDIVRRLPCNRRPRADFDIEALDSGMAGPLKEYWDKLWLIESGQSPNEARPASPVDNDRLLEVPDSLPPVLNPWLDDMEFPPQKLSEESAKVVYSPIGIADQVVNDFFASSTSFEFLEATSDYSRKETACLFLQLMMKASLSEVSISQSSPFGPIHVSVSS